MPELPELFDVPALVEQYPDVLYDELVYRWLRSGELAGFKLGKRWVVTGEDWRLFIDRRREAAS